MNEKIKRVRSKVILFIASLSFWLLFTMRFDFVNILVGICCSFIVVFLVSDVVIQDQWEFKKPFRYLWFLYYIPILGWEVFKANLDVAFRILHPVMPINPGIVKIKTNLKSDIGLTFLANSITLTPGTMSVEIDRENGFIYVHWINVRTQDIEQATKIISSKFERILEKIFV